LGREHRTLTKGAGNIAGELKAAVPTRACVTKESHTHQNWMGYVTFNPETSELVVAIRGTILMREWLADLRGLIPFNYPQSKASKLKDQSPSDQIRIHRGFYQLYTNKVTWANTLAPIFRRKIQRSLSRSSSFFLASLKTDSIPVSEEELEEQASKRDSNKKSLKVLHPHSESKWLRSHPTNLRNTNPNL